MGKVRFMYPVADVCGKVDTESNVVFCHLGNTKYTRIQTKRTKPLSEDELARQEKFAQVTKRTRQRMLDPTQMAKDQAAFAAQNKYKTLYQYVFNQEWNA